MEHLQYPIGRFNFNHAVSEDQIPGLTASIAQLPEALNLSVHDLSNALLNSPYRTDGWTIRQVVHHIADAHINGYTRFRMALTEAQPTITPYDEVKWAQLEDARTMPVDTSLTLISALHQRWVHLIKTLDNNQMQTIYRHPVSGDISLCKAVHLYAWHGNHHLAHITEFRRRIGL